MIGEKRTVRTVHPLLECLHIHQVIPPATGTPLYVITSGALDDAKQLE